VAEISLSHIENFILKGITLKIGDGELFVLVGPSGAGKTTLLNVMAGLAPCRGRISFNNNRIDHLPAYKREVGYLFQDLLLFPHVTVKKNVMFGMARINQSKKLKQERVNEILNLLKISHLAGRYPATLSGGERQRAALARALVSSPMILLLDEPFASLDFRTARYLRLELKRLQGQLRTTMLFVTHNIEEAFELGDRVGVMQEGRLEQVGRADELRLREDMEGVHFLESPNILDCASPKTIGNGLVEVRWAGLRLFVPDDGRPIERVAIQPRDVFISSLPPPGPPINRFKGTVKEIRRGGGMAKLLLSVEGISIRSEITMEYLNSLGLSQGDHVYGILKLRSLHGC